MRRTSRSSPRRCARAVAPSWAEPRVQLSGYSWYDELARVAAMTIRIDEAAGPILLRDADHDDEPEADTRPERITLILAVTDSDGTERTVEVPSDVAFAHTHSPYAENVGLTLAKGATISGGRLQEMINAGYWRFDDGIDGGSCNEQLERLGRNARQAIRKAVDGERNARLSRIGEEARRMNEIVAQLPAGGAARVTWYRDGDVDVEMTDDSRQWQRPRVAAV